MTERIGYYPGCSLHTSAKEYDLATRAVLQAVGMDCTEIPDWNCCGASSAHTRDHSLSYALPLRNLIQAQGCGQELVVPCAACYSLLRTTEGFLAGQSEPAKQLQGQVEKILGKDYNRTVKVTHPLDLLTRREVLARIKERQVRSLSGLRVAPYYGCFLVRPELAAFDNPEQPQKMDVLLRELGAEVVRWSYKTECCGGGLGITQGTSARPLVDRLVLEAKNAGAQALVTACPLCQANLEGRASNPIPVFYFTELVGLALNLPNSQKWLKSHLVDVSPVLTRLEGVISGGR
ncbi:MAG TPA: CoB--CoM heterodisulfide reductase iron-sulfur subunit B family protein [Verrucomicrobiae bacterium]|nr:CoB--CoM heterodisulfide reductase iron-sulfur subunit B family protein [Verrucomicrobiae bacterium]